MITTITAIGGFVGLVISIGLLAWQTHAVAQQTEISNRIAGLSAINGATAGLREVHLLFVSDPGLRPYFYDGKAYPRRRRQRDRVLTVAELLLDYSRVSALVSKSTFRLSSRRGVHEITIEIRSIKEVVEADGQHAVTTYSNKPKPYRLEALSSALGPDVTVEWTKDLNAFRIKLLILKIGDQVLRYKRGLSDR